MPRAYSDQVRVEAIRLLCDGHSIVSVAEELGVNRNTVHRWQRRLAEGTLSADYSNCGRH